MHITHIQMLSVRNKTQASQTAAPRTHGYTRLCNSGGNHRHRCCCGCSLVPTTMKTWLKEICKRAARQVHHTNRRRSKDPQSQKRTTRYCYSTGVLGGLSAFLLIARTVPVLEYSVTFYNLLTPWLVRSQTAQGV